MSVKIWILLLLGLLTLGLVAWGVFWIDRNEPAQLPIETSEPNEQKSNMEEIANNLSIPWGMAFLPEKKLIVTERSGRVLQINGNEKTEIGRIDGVLARGEGGLLGVTTDPNFLANNYLYFYYSYSDESMKNKVVRFTLRENKLTDELVLIDDIPGASNHNGGGLAFGPDGKLFVTTGDASQQNLAQDKSSLAGKILRLESDGGIPTDNPFGNAVWAYGLRNPQGLAWHASEILYATEHGPSAMDEINLIERGKNYGWPIYECGNKKGGGDIENTDPIACYADFTMAPSGIAVLNNSIFIGGLRGQQLRRLDLGNDLRTISKQSEVFNDFGRIRGVKVNDEVVYFATNNTDGRGTPKSGDDRIISFAP